MSFFLPALLLAAGSASAADAPPAVASGTVAVSTPTYSGPGLKLVSEGGLPRFEESFKGRASLVRAARKALKYLQSLPPSRTLHLADRDYAPAALIESAKAMIEIAQAAKDADELDRRVRETFDVFQSNGLDGQGRVVFSAYYTPEVRASRTKTPTYAYPLYRRPSDMVEVDLASFGKSTNGDPPLLGRIGGDRRVTPYFTRDDIEHRKALAGKGYEIAWLKDPLDEYDLHIEGSAILKLTDGRQVLARYAATNERPFVSVGMLLVKAGLMSRDEISNDRLREYLRANPGSASWILAQDPRYTFFELRPLPADGEPPGAAGQALAPARAIAIDPSVVPLGALAFFTAPCPQADKDGHLLGVFPSARFAFALDTGGAIKGPGRVDIYVGHGPAAEAIAHQQWSDGKLYVLVKKLPARER